MQTYLTLLLKGIAMGAANVIPGVSGGTIALITNIFERLINAIKSFNIRTFKLLISGKFKAFAKETDLWFLITVFGGVAIAILSLARLFDYLFNHYPVYVWAYFFGLVLASVYFVGKTVSKWHKSVIISLFTGLSIAIIISLLNPATENDSFLYLLLCGAAGVCSMILPGLSGSFILFVMGNYQLVMIDAVNELNLQILIPVIIGAALGLLAFSHLLSLVLRKYRNQTIALLTGFILGSLRILWPWQRPVYLTNASGEALLKDGSQIIVNYQQYFPESFSREVLFALIWITLGVASITVIELLAKKHPHSTS